MNFLEAMKLLQEGKKIRKSNWRADAYILAHPHGFNGFIYDENGNIYNGLLSEFVNSSMLEEYTKSTRPEFVELPPYPLELIRALYDKFSDNTKVLFSLPIQNILMFIHNLYQREKE